MQVHRIWLAWLLLGGACVWPSAAQAFGADGHRISGHIAQAALTSQARAQLEQILGHVDLAELALAADEQRAQLKARFPDSPRWHYDDRLVCHPDLPVEDYCPRGACASAAITRFRAVLADRAAPREERALAVMFLVHIIGDIHQPLHAADNNDRGGNSARVAMPGESGTRSLHAAWDIDFVRLAMDGARPPAIADDWARRYQRELAQWRRGTVADWMQESYMLAATVTYGELPEWACDTPPAGVLALTPEYVAHATRLMPELLTKAGVRIAAVLNDALSRGTGAR